MTEEKHAETGVRARTRFAILEAARKMLPTRPSASILEIAEVAGVGRSTIHRYFPDRSDLIDELARHVYRLSNEAIARAKPDSGSPTAALRRVIEEQFDLGPALDFIYNERMFKEKPELLVEFASGDQQVAEAIRNAGREGTGVPFEWQERVFWTLLRLGAEVAAEGHARHEIIDSIMTTLTTGFVKVD